MKRIKRAVAVLLAVMMVFSVIGCGGSSGSKKSDSSSKETKELLSRENKPTCVFMPDDYSAMGAFNAVKEMGLSVPGKYSFVAIRI